MRVKFMQNGISYVIKTTNVHYCDLSDESEDYDYDDIELIQ